jgi:hypothetical protein
MLLCTEGLVRTLHGRRAPLATALVLLGSLPATAATVVLGPDGNLQAAIDAARPGDTIVLTPGATYTGNFKLPPTGGTAEITIRTAPDSRLPIAGQRVTPFHSAWLAKIRSGNSLPAIQTMEGAHHWRLELLEIQANANGFGEIVRLGLGGTGQTTLAQVPHNIVIDRCYIQGDPLLGQKRGIGLNSASTTIVNSHIADIKGVGMDTQAIGGWNGPGPYVIENNYLEAAGENVLFGGADPKIPDLIPSDITLRGNHLTKPRSWQAPIIPTPVASATAVSGGGALAPGTYAYRVVARRPVGQGTVGDSMASIEASATLGATGSVRVTWASVADATEYRVYGRTPSGQAMYWTVTGTQFVDTGAAGASGAVPGDGSRWTVKNIFELKNARRVLAEGNVFEHNWRHGQGGVAIVLTPRNQDGTAPWSGVSDVTLRYNIVRHAGGAMSINGYDDKHPSQPAQDIRVEHNLFTDISAADGSGRFLIMGNRPRRVTIEHNTILQSDTILLVHPQYSDGSYAVVEGFRFANNLTVHNTFGIVGEGGGGFGTSSILNYFLTEAAVVRNVLAGGPASRYPADNLFPDVASFMAEFVDAAGGDFRLRTGSPYRNAGTDGRNLGADVEQIAAREAAVLQGLAIGSPQSPTPPSAPRNLRVVTTQP